MQDFFNQMSLLPWFILTFCLIFFQSFQLYLCRSWHVKPPNPDSFFSLCVSCLLSFLPQPAKLSKEICSPNRAIQDGANFVFLSNNSSVPDCYHYGLGNLGALCGSTSVCPSYVLALVLGQDWAVHQSHSSFSQQTYSSVNMFPWRLNLAWGTAGVFQKGPYWHKKRSGILVCAAQQVRRICAGLNVFMNSSSSQLWSIYLELMQPLPDLLLCIHLCKGLISSWIMPVTTLTLKRIMKINFSLMWIFL